MNDDTGLVSGERRRDLTVRESLPREDSGKLLKRVLREPYWRGTGRSI